MKRYLLLAWRAVKWLAVGLLFLELLSFCVISTSNWILFGSLHEGPKAVYDAYSLFRMTIDVWPTSFVVNHPARKDLFRTIWFFGGSTMRASNGPMETTIPSLVAKTLNEENKPFQFDCINFGINAFNSLLEVKLLEKEYIEATERPDLVVFYDGANDANYFAVQKNRYAHAGRERVKGVIESSYKNGVGILKPLVAAYYTSFTRELLEKLCYAVRPVDPNSPELAAFVDLTVKRYDFVDHLCASFGARFVLFLQPIYWTETCRNVTPEVDDRENRTILGRKMFPHIRDNFMTVYGALERALSGKPYCVRLRNALCGRNVSAFTADGVHNTVSGRQAIARALLPALRARLSLNPIATNGGQP